MLLCGKPFQALLNIVLTLLIYFPGMIHAILVVNNHYADQRTKKIVKALERQKQ